MQAHSHFLYNSKKNFIESEGNWSETKGKIKQKFALLTDSEILLIAGKKDEILGYLKIKLGKTKEDIQKITDAQ